MINIAYAVRCAGTDTMLCGHKEMGIFKRFSEMMPCRFNTVQEATEICEKLIVGNGYRNLAPSAQSAPYPTDLEVIELITVAGVLAA